MAKPLVIVESPAKARTISNYLKDQYLVKASVGHIKDLPESRLGVDIEDGFTPEYSVIKGKVKVLKEIKKAAEKAEAIYLATDPDREGEAIAWHIAEELNRPSANVHRVLFNEITARSIRSHGPPERLNRNKFEAQQARRILDRLVGYLISPLLWEKSPPRLERRTGSDRRRPPALRTGKRDSGVREPGILDHRRFS